MNVVLAFPAVLYALLALPVLALLKMFLPQSQRVTVGSLMFWEDARAESALDRARMRRRLDLATVLMLATLAAIILALSGPRLVRGEPSGPAGIILIDRSPSLLMTDGSAETRLAKLRRRLGLFLDALPADIPLVTDALPLDGPAEHRDGPAAALRDAVVDGLRPATRALDAAELRRRVIALRSRYNAPLILFTDVSPYSDAIGQPAGVRVVATGAEAANVGVTGGRVTWRDGRPYIMIRVAASPGVRPEPVLVIGGDGVSVREPLAAAPGEHTWTAPLPRALGDRLTVEIDAADDFVADNSLRLTRVKGRHYRVGIAGRRDAAILRFLEAIDAEVYAFDSEAAPPEGTVDVMIFVDQTPTAGFRGAAVLVDPPRSVGPLARTDTTGGPGRWIVADAADPLARYIEQSEARIDSWPVFRTGAGAETVMRSESGDPLVVRWRSAEELRVAILFSIDRANTAWSAEPSFVLFWANCLAMLAPEAPVVERFEPEDPSTPAIAAVEGRQTAGPAVDESAAARSAFVGHQRDVRPAVFPLWAAMAALGLGLMVARLWILR